MSWSAPRPPAAVAAYAEAEADMAARPERYTLGAEPILERLAADGVAPPDAHVREGLEVYLASAREEGRLNALGRRNVAASAAAKLRAGRSIARALDADPAIRERVINRPIFIIGGWRTGTTLMQRLMAGLPGLRGALPAELTVPWRFANLSPDAREALLDAGEGAHARLHGLNPTMASIHPSGGRLEEECVLAMGTDFRNWGFTSTLRSPSYARWLLAQDMDDAYRRLRETLQLLQGEDGRHWVLKAPAHTAALPSLWAAFPDAIVVHLHRDVVETVVSGASLFAVFRSTYSDQVDPADVGDYQLGMTAAWFDRALAARAAQPQRQVIDVAFPELVADPVATVRRICEAADVAWTPQSDAAAAARLQALRKQHGAHTYTPEQFGLTPAAIRERLTAYREAFPGT